jgi:hypothetical protein
MFHVEHWNFPFRVRLWMKSDIDIEDWVWWISDVVGDTL